MWMTAIPHQLMNPVTAVILKNQLNAAEALLHPFSVRTCLPRIAFFDATNLYIDANTHANPTLDENKTAQ